MHDNIWFYLNFHVIHWKIFIKITLSRCWKYLYILCRDADLEYFCCIICSLNWITLPLYKFQNFASFESSFKSSGYSYDLGRKYMKQWDMIRTSSFENSLYVMCPLKRVLFIISCEMKIFWLSAPSKRIWSIKFSMKNFMNSWIRRSKN